MNSVTIAVLTYNRPDLLEQCLNAIDAQQDCPHVKEKLIVDNGSSYALKPLRNRPGWKTVLLPENRGNIGGMNACFEEAKCESVLFVSNDVIMLPGSIKHLTCSIYADCRMTMPMIFRPDGKIDNCGLRYIWPGYGVSRKRPSDFGDINIIPGICFLLPRGLWRGVGKFYEGLESSHEDVDFSLRLKANGINRRLDTCSMVIHMGNQTLRNTIASKDKHGIFHKARIKTIERNFSGWNRRFRVWAVNIIDGIHWWKKATPRILKISQISLLLCFLFTGRVIWKVLTRADLPSNTGATFEYSTAVKDYEKQFCEVLGPKPPLCYGPTSVYGEGAKNE